LQCNFKIFQPIFDYSKAFNTNLLVENYPIKERSKEETQFLEKVKLLRKIEIATKKTSADLSLEIMKNDNVKEMVGLIFLSYI
jgi:hypothetical protein